MGGAYSGGFAGSLWGLNIKNCYATGDVTGAFASMATFAGTDAPAAYAYGSVTNCYTTGAVVGTASGTYAFVKAGIFLSGVPDLAVQVDQLPEPVMRPKLSSPVLRLAEASARRAVSISF